MINVTSNDAHIVQRGAEWLEDAAEDRASGYDFDRDDRESITRIGKLRRGLLVTGDQFTEDEGLALLKEVITSELEHWVPGSSQRLINRAGVLLVGGPILIGATEADHGPGPADHALLQDWVAGIFVLRCVTCSHLFKI